MFLRSAVAAALLLTAAVPAAAWKDGEHKEIGSQAYARACAQLASSPDLLTERYALACGPVASNPHYLQPFGELCAVAGDHAQTPDDLLSEVAGRGAVNPFRYGLLAFTNYRHFHPMAPRTWATYHQAAVSEALEAAVSSARQMEAAFEEALLQEAFASHFLQDSFASGHMGFNRSASSVSATVSYHDRWNWRGRRVSNLTGAQWTAFGDGRLNDEEACDAREMVIAAATASLKDMLVSFISGSREDDRYAKTARALIPIYETRESTFPYFMEMMMFPRQWSKKPEVESKPTTSIETLGEPAEVFATIDFWSFIDTNPSERDVRVERGVVIGTSGAVAPISLGTRIVPARYYFGVGRATAGGRWFLDVGYLLRVYMTSAGFVTYEIGVGNNFSAHRTLRAIGGVNFELGKYYIRVQGGAGRAHHRWGSYTTFGVGRVLSSHLGR